MKEKPSELAPGIHMLEIPFPSGWMPPDAPPSTLSYLVEEEEGWLMVDSGFNHDTCFDSLCQQLAALGTSFNDIRWLLITHFHPDHFGLAGRIRAASGAKVVMHQEDWNLARFIVESPEEWSIDQIAQWLRSLGVPPSELVGYRQVVAFGKMLFPKNLEPDILLQGEEERLGERGYLRAILTPGHTPGHLCLYDEKNKVLFSGDHVLSEITTHIAPIDLAGHNQLDRYLKSLRRLQRLEVELVLPAHEKPFTHLSQRVEELLEHHRQRLEQVLLAVRHHPLSPLEIASQVQWMTGLWEQMDAMNRLLAIQETLAHLHLLQENGHVTMVERDGLTLYKLGNEG